METKPGTETSEFKFASVLFIAGTALEAVAAALQSLSDNGSQMHWLAGALVLAGALKQIFAFLGYNKGRATLKAASIRAQGGMAEAIAYQESKTVAAPAAVGAVPVSLP